MTTAAAPTPPLTVRAMPEPLALVDDAVSVIVHEPREDVTDGDLARAVVFGLTVGTLGVFVVTLVIALGAGVSLGSALAVAALPGIFGGVYFGGAPALLTCMLRFEAQERRAMSTNRTAGSTPGDDEELGVKGSGGGRFPRR